MSAGTKRSPWKRDVTTNKSTVCNGRCGCCAVRAEVSKSDDIGRQGTKVGPRKTVVRHSGARTWGQRKAEAEIHSDVESDVPTNVSFETALTSVSASYCPEEMQTRSVKDSRNPIGSLPINDDMDNVTLPTDVVSDKTVNDDTLTETDVDVSEGEGLATISRNNELIRENLSHRCVLPRCSNTLRKPRIEHSTQVQSALRHPSKDKLSNSLPSAVSANGNSSVMTNVIPHKDNHTLVDKDRSASHRGVPPYDRHSLSPVRRRGASTSMVEGYFTNTPQIDRHSASVRQLSSISRVGQCLNREVSLRIEHPDVLRHSRVQQTDKTEDEPVSAKERFSPYVSSIRKSWTDEPASRTQWEGKRGTSPSAGECLRNQERRKSCRETSTGQKTSNKRLYRSSSSDSETEDTDHGAQKKSTPSTDGKTPHHTTSRSPTRNSGHEAAHAREPAKSSKTEALSRTPSPDTSQPNGRRFCSRKGSSSSDKILRKPSASPSPTRSTVSSPSLSENKEEEYSKVHTRKHSLKPPTFDGTQPFETFWAKFCNCAEYNDWNEKDKLAFLRNSLEGDVSNVLWDYGDELTNSFSKLIATLKQRFSGQAFVDKHRLELRNRRRKKNETLQSLHADIRRLAALAFPTVEHMARGALAIDYFLDALDDADFALRVRQRQLVSLDSALAVELQMEVWANDTRIRRVESESSVEIEQVPEIGEQSVSSFDCFEPNSEVLQEEVTEARKEAEEVRKRIAELEAKLASVVPVSYAGDTAGTGPRPCYCFCCGRMGHFAKDCPTHVSGIDSSSFTKVSNDNQQVPRSSVSTPYKTRLPEVRPVRRKQSWTCINVKYGKHKMTALLDTGSDITVIGSVLAKKLNWEMFPPAFTMVKAANGDDMLISGVAYVILRVGTQDIDSEVLISPDMTGLILGIDCMQMNECVFHCKEKQIRVNNEWVELKREPSEQRIRKIYVTEDTLLLPSQ